MATHNCAPATCSLLLFGFLALAQHQVPAQVKQLSVKQIRNPVTMDSASDKALPDGLHDPALGLIDSRPGGTCETCGLSAARCPGHFGHIELPVPVYNPLLIKCAPRPGCFMVITLALCTRMPLNVGRAVHLRQ
jgi:DNA-directed RNA polymerase I subunit RPA1